MEEITDHLIKIAIAQIAQEAGFEGARRSALDALTEVVRRYIQELAENVSQSAALASRTEPNWHDVKGSLEEMGIDLNELVLWREQSDSLPFAFAHALPRIPLPKKVTLIQPSTAMDIKRKPSSIPAATAAASGGAAAVIDSGVYFQKGHIPPFVPAFPDRRTYQNNPIFVERETDIRKIRKKKVEQNRKVEQALTRMHKEAAQVNIPKTELEDGDEKEDKEKEILLPRHYKHPSSLLTPVPNRTPYWGTVLEPIPETAIPTKSKKRKKRKRE